MLDHDCRRVNSDEQTHDGRLTRAISKELCVVLLVLALPVLAQEQETPTPAPVRFPQEEFTVEDRILVVLDMARRWETTDPGSGQRFLKDTGVSVDYAQKIQAEFDAEAAASRERVCAKRAQLTTGAALGHALDEEEAHMTLLRRSKVTALDANQRVALLDLTQRVSMHKSGKDKREPQLRGRDPQPILDRVCGATDRPDSS